MEQPAKSLNRLSALLAVGVVTLLLAGCGEGSSEAALQQRPPEHKGWIRDFHAEISFDQLCEVAIIDNSTTSAGFVRTLAYAEEYPKVDIWLDQGNRGLEPVGFVTVPLWDVRAISLIAATRHEGRIAKTLILAGHSHDSLTLISANIRNDRVVERINLGVKMPGKLECRVVYQGKGSLNVIIASLYQGRVRYTVVDVDWVEEELTVAASRQLGEVDGTHVRWAATQGNYAVAARRSSTGLYLDRVCVDPKGGGDLFSVKEVVSDESQLRIETLTQDVAEALTPIMWYPDPFIGQDVLAIRSGAGDKQAILSLSRRPLMPGWDGCWIRGFEMPEELVGKFPTPWESFLPLTRPRPAEGSAHLAEQSTTRAVIIFHFLYRDNVLEIRPTELPW